MKRIALFLALVCLFAGCKKEILPEAVALNQQTISLEVGETFVLEATVTPSNVTNPALIWSSTQPSVATVGQDGKVIALSNGQAVVTVTTLSGGKTDACVVTVYSKSGPGPEPGEPVEGVSVSPATLEIAEGATAQLTATVSPADAVQDVMWASLNPEIASVDNSGLVTGKTKGSTKIYARSTADQDKQGVCEVTVIQDPTLKGIALSSNEISLTVGQTFTLEVIYTPSYATNKKVSWASDNTAVASVSSEGLVKGLSEGTAKVTATSDEGGYTASCMVTVGKSSGARVYYKLANYSQLYVNGVQDTEAGEYIFMMYPEGSDLYSVEQTLVDNKIDIYLCKNHKPVSLARRDGKGSEVTMTVRNGKAAAVFKNGDDYYVSIVSPDGSVKFVDITGDFQSISDISCAWAPNGDLYILANTKDAFLVYSITLFRYKADGTWAEPETIRKSIYSGHLAIDENGDVYIFTKKDDIERGHGFVLLLYKNGEICSEVDKPDGYTPQALCVYGGHVYTAVQANSQTVIRCDGEPLYTLETPGALINIALQVTSSGDVYLASEYHIYKNDKVAYALSERCNYACVVE